MSFYGNFSITAPQSLSDEYLNDINENLNILNRGVSMLWFIIALICGGILPYVLNKNAKRTLLYIGIILMAMLFYVNETMNYFNLEFANQRFFNIIILAFLVAHIINLFEED